MSKTVFGLIAVALLPCSCAPRPEPPVAELSAGVAEVALVYASSSLAPIEWKSLRDLDPPDASPSLFVHLLDGGGRIVRAYDRPVPGTRLEGDDTIEIWQSLLAEPLPVGWYRLTAGIYDLATGRRWRLETGGVEIDEGEYEIVAVEVESTRRRTPDLVFGGEWLEADEGQPHNPGRRWMGERGTIRLLRTAGWSELVLTLSMLELPASQYRLIYRDGASAPQLVIRNGCDNGSESRFDGYGMRSVALRLDAGEDVCVITLKPNYVTLGPEGKRRSVGLETAFFRPSRRSSF